MPRYSAIRQDCRTTEITRLEANLGALQVQISEEEVSDIRNLLRDISGLRGIPGPMMESFFVSTPPLKAQL